MAGLISRKTKAAFKTTLVLAIRSPGAQCANRLRNTRLNVTSGVSKVLSGEVVQEAWMYDTKLALL